MEVMRRTMKRWYDGEGRTVMSSAGETGGLTNKYI